MSLPSRVGRLNLAEPRRGLLAGVPDPAGGTFSGNNRLLRSIQWSGPEITSGRFRIGLHRFLADSIPAVSACIWTWVRLVGAPGRFIVREEQSDQRQERALELLEDLSGRIYADRFGNCLGLSAMLTDAATMLFRDGLIGGFISIAADGSAVERFLPIDPAQVRVAEDAGRVRLVLENDSGEIGLARPDFYYTSLGDRFTHPTGHSILSTIPFVSYIEQQLIDDMRRTSHNAGFHRLHVKITPPERLGGESDTAYADRINSYFDATVDMIRTCEVDDNPVTWDNIAIEHVGPSKSRDVTNSWFMNHRAMIEEICAGTNLAPFMLGYSYGATTTWSDFKFDIVMRQVQSVQRQMSDLLEWIGNIELALHGMDARCRYRFDNTLSYQIADQVKTKSVETDNLLRLYEAGLIDEESARRKAERLL